MENGIAQKSELQMGFEQLEKKGYAVIHGFKITRTINQQFTNGLITNRIIYSIIDEIDEICKTIERASSAQSEYENNRIINEICETIARQVGIKDLIIQNLQNARVNLKVDPKLFEKIVCIIKYAFNQCGSYCEFPTLQEWNTIYSETLRLTTASKRRNGQEIPKVNLGNNASSVVLHYIYEYFT